MLALNRDFLRGSGAAAAATALTGAPPPPMAEATAALADEKAVQMGPACGWSGWAMARFVVIGTSNPAARSD